MAGGNNTSVRRKTPLHLSFPLPRIFRLSFSRCGGPAHTFSTPTFRDPARENGYSSSRGVNPPRCGRIHMSRTSLRQTARIKRRRAPDFTFFTAEKSSYTRGDKEPHKPSFARDLLRAHHFDNIASRISDFKWLARTNSAIKAGQVLECLGKKLILHKWILKIFRRFFYPYCWVLEKSAH